MRCRSLAASVLCAVAASGIGRAQDLSERLRALDRDGVRVGVCVLPREGGGALFSWRASGLFVPASNQKLLTGIAVLGALGPDYRFRTPVSLRRGVLVLTAGGDPNWATAGAYDPGRMFERLAKQLREAGVAAVRGVEFDEHTFPGPVRPAGWPRRQFDQPYCAPTSGFAVDANCFRVELRPGADGTAAVEQLAPAVPLKMRGSIHLTDDVREGGQYRMWVRGSALEIRGHLLRSARPRTVRGVLGQPLMVLRRQLEEALADAGIAIEADAPTVDTALETITTPLRPALREMLKESSNFHAEQLVRVLGLEVAGEGSLEAGQHALRRVLDARLALPTDVVLADGSGLGRENRVTPNLVATLLQQALHAEPDQVLELVGALPQGGVDGTLANRFENSPLRGRVRAKTGWIRGASSLSGYVQDEDGELRAFSILMNYDPGRPGLNRRLKAEQERIVEAIAEL